MSDFRQLLQVKAASLLVGKSERTIYRWIHLGKIHGYKIQAHVCVDLQELLEAEHQIYLRSKPKTK